MKYGLFKFQLDTNKIKEEQYLGMDCYVVPAIPLKEGVLNGKLVRHEELERTANFWESMPVLINHPESIFGFKESARDKDVLDSQQTGYMFDVEYKEADDKKILACNVYLVKEWLRTTDEGQDIEHRIKEGKTIDNSVGFFYQADETEGKFGNDEYELIAKNIIPDHLAILPYDKGACSVEDGCGLNQFKKEENNYMYNQFISINEEFISKDDIGTGDKIEIDNSEDAAYTGSWGSRDHVNDRNTILEASNYVSLSKEMYLMLDSNWEDAPSQKLHYPHHTISNGKLVVSVEGVKAARSFLERSDTKSSQAAEKHLKKHYNELDLEWGIDEENNKENNNLESFVKKSIGKIINLVKGTNMNKKDLIMQNFDFSEDEYDNLRDNTIDKLYSTILISQNEDNDDDAEKEENDTLDLSDNLVEKLENYDDEIVIKALDEYDKRQEEMEDKKEELVDELEDKTNFEKDELSEMKMDVLEKLSDGVKEESAIFVRNNGNADSGGNNSGKKEYKKSYETK